jgi:hypothetical protein
VFTSLRVCVLAKLGHDAVVARLRAKFTVIYRDVPGQNSSDVVYSC